jgi:hypothetical protein
MPISKVMTHTVAGGLAGAEGKLLTDWFDDKLVSSVYVQTIFRIIQGEGGAVYPP